MELRDFIRETLVGIATGVQEAKLRTSDLWAINPGKLNGESVTEKSYIEFDVALTVTETAETQKGGGGGLKAEVSVLGSKVGGGAEAAISGSTGSSSEKVSRVSFRVPVYMNADYRGDNHTKEEARRLTVAAAGQQS